jgi:hypothetical protein
LFGGRHRYLIFWVGFFLFVFRNSFDANDWKKKGWSRVGWEKPQELLLLPLESGALVGRSDAPTANDVAIQFLQKKRKKKSPSCTCN